MAAASFTVAVHFSFSCSLLLLLACSSSPQAQARESQFFSKTSRSDVTAREATPAKEELPAPVKEEEPVQYKPDSTGNGFGLYGHGPEKLPPATTSSPSSYPTYNYNRAGGNFNTDSITTEFNNDEFNGVSYENKEFNTAGYPDSNKNNAYTNKKPASYNAGNIPENELSGGSYSYKYDSKEANARYPRNGNQPEAQLGMSDTRTLDNGRYFYDLSAEESYRKGRYDPAAYGSFGADESFANGGYTYGNNNNNNRGNGYEENNSMQGYYQNNEENNTQQNQEEYVP